MQAAPVWTVFLIPVGAVSQAQRLQTSSDRLSVIRAEGLELRDWHVEEPDVTPVFVGRRCLLPAATFPAPESESWRPPPAPRTAAETDAGPDTSTHIELLSVLKMQPFEPIFFKTTLKMT